MKTFKKLQNLFFNHRFIFENAPEKGGEGQKIEDKQDKVSEDAKKGRADIADQSAQEATQKPETQENQLEKGNPAGKIHGKYFEKTEAIKEEDAEKDRESLRKQEIKDIRFNSRLLKPKAENEDEASQAANIKEETQKRIKAYTEKADANWYTLNYQRLGSDKKGRSHEMNIGIGDILLDPDITEVLVKRKNGEVIKAHRGVVPTRQMYSGRQAFLDENNKYVDTYTGESFRILSNEETDLKNPEALKKYLGTFSAEEKVREENAKNFENEMKAMEDQDAYYTDANLDPSKSVVEQIKIPLTASQKESAKVIERVFKEGLKGKEGLTDEAIAKIIAAAIVNSYKESGLNASNDTGDGGHSIGLFQVNDVAGAGTHLLKTMSREESIAYRQNPENNAKIILEREVLGQFGRPLLAAAKDGASVTKLAALFSRYIERPRDTYGAMQGRSQAALKMFGERVVNTGEEISERIDDGKEGYNGKGIIKLKSNQDTWIFGSSGAVAMNNMKNSLNLGNTGFFGVVGINPMNFKEKLETMWPKISQLKPPKQIVLVGMATNGLGADTDKLIQKNFDAYAAIKDFLEKKGIKVKIATVQPTEERKEQIQKFNNLLREKYPADSLIDIAKYTTTDDGKGRNPEYASADGIHLGKRGYEKFASLIKESADKEKTA